MSPRYEEKPISPPACASRRRSGASCPLSRRSWKARWAISKEARTSMRKSSGGVGELLRAFYARQRVDDDLVVDQDDVEQAHAVFQTAPPELVRSFASRLVPMDEVPGERSGVVLSQACDGSDHAVRTWRCPTWKPVVRADVRLLRCRLGGRRRCSSW